MRITTFGAGYVGLVTGTCLAELGHETLIVDVDPTRVTSLRAGVMPFYEPGLADLVRRNVAAGRLQFGPMAPPPFDESDVYFIAVGTPQAFDGRADVSAVTAVAKTLASVARKSAVVAVKSTVPVGTCDAVQALVGDRLEVVSNPEFLKEGAAVADFFRPDRIVVGARCSEPLEVMRRLYEPLQLAGDIVIAMNVRSSELTKYAANTMLATRVSFMNELARLCHATGADIHDVRLGVGSDARIGRRFIYAGPGYGGSCFPKDVQALIRLSADHGVPSEVALATHAANEAQIAFVRSLVEEALLPPLTGRRVAFWGLAFKPETDDVREAPAVRLARSLLACGIAIAGHDPEASTNFLQAVPAASVSRHQYDVLEGADLLVLLTEWRCYRTPDFARIRGRMRRPVVLDTRNTWPAEAARAAGIDYRGLGRSVC